MRYLAIVIFLLCVHVSAAFVNSVGVFDHGLNPADEWFNEIDDQRLKDESYIQSQVETDFWGGVGEFVKGLFYFIVTFAWGIIYVPYTLQGFGMVQPFIYYISIPVYALYFLAMAQLIANRSTKTMG